MGFLCILKYVKQSLVYCIMFVLSATPYTYHMEGPVKDYSKSIANALGLL